MFVVFTSQIVSNKNLYYNIFLNVSFKGAVQMQLILTLFLLNYIRFLCDTVNILNSLSYINRIGWVNHIKINLALYKLMDFTIKFVSFKDIII